MPLPLVDLGMMSYDEALAVQRAHHAEVLAARDGADDAAPIGRVLLVEHVPAVITLGRRPGAERHLVADAARLVALGVEVRATDRGGDITYHGPGQLVAYPIVDLNRARIRLHDYMRRLEQAVIDVCSGYGISARREQGATGVWVDGAGPGGSAAKVCAIGVRVQRWVTMHGLALNVTTNLEHFDLIVPCGLQGRTVTSLQRVLGEACPSMQEVKERLVESLTAQLTAV
ncbi:MAG: lipoyl(octanoyl) transferase LipB [Phycisphaerales bacterium]|nr:lipoyl(octanoyl) transferase LipB [Phycisphaerales bacterium]